MCGIAGILSIDSSIVSKEKLKRMTDVIAHRGPDGEDSWINANGIVGLGHRRLSIIDLSKTGAQPMHYLGRYTIIHNGEIYNYIELKEQLMKKGYLFQSQSDTEIILASYDYWKTDCLQHFDGMFAFAIWDEKEQLLFCARDRFGEKPFYYHYDDQQFFFGSEIKALWMAGIPKAVYEPLLLNYLCLGSTTHTTDKEKTFYKQIFNLPAGHYLSIAAPEWKLTITSYYDMEKESSITFSDKEAIERFTDLFTTSITRRLRSDVPLGTSLSGGLDSSGIVAIMQKLLPEAKNYKQKTFTAAFPDFDKDESAYARQVAQQFNLQHFITSPTADEFASDLTTLLYHHEEPISSSSVYAQYKVFELAKQNDVKVLLDGQGADEMLAGYYKYIHWYLQELLVKPTRIRNELNALRQNNIPFEWGWKNYLAAIFPAQTANQLEKREVKKIRQQTDISEDFRQNYFDRLSIHKPLVSKLNDILYFNTCQSGLDELLRYADRNSMAHGREVRLPFLYHELAAFLFMLPSHFKIHAGQTKWLFRKSMENKLPPEIVWRTNKIAFEPPQQLWMKNKKVQDMITQSKEKLVKEKILKETVLTKKIQPHDAYAADKYDWCYLVSGMLLQ